MVGNVAEAEDLTQEAFLQLHRKIGTFRGDSAFSTWLHRLAINVVLMQLRKKSLSLISLDEAMEPAPEEGPGRSFGAPDLMLTGAIDRLRICRPGTVSYLSFTTWKGSSIMRLPPCWTARLETANLSCTRRG
jgi:RNA polymerase sigma-70 factor (ECF subfamily)